MQTILAPSDMISYSNAKSSFIHAHVFPGGVVDKHDDASLWQPLLKQQPTTEYVNHVYMTEVEQLLTGWHHRTFQVDQQDLCYS